MGLRRWISILKASYTTRRIRRTNEGKVFLALVWILILILGIYGVFIALTVPAQRPYREITFRDFMDYVKTGRAESYFLKFSEQKADQDQRLGPYGMVTGEQYQKNTLIIFVKLRGGEIVKTEKIEYSITPYTSFERMIKEGTIENIIIPEYNNYGLYFIEEKGLFLVNFDWSYIDQKSLFQICLANEVNLWELPVSSVPEEPSMGIFDPKWPPLLVFTIFFAMYLIFLPLYNHQKAKSEATAAAEKMAISPFKITLDDVGGLQEVKKKIREIIDMIKDPEGYRAMGAKLPKGMTIYGPPGCGKTLTARGTAGEAGVPFIAKNAAEFGTEYVRSGAKDVRAFFSEVKATAKETGKCVIVFLDEIDAVGTRKISTEGGQEFSHAITQLNGVLDGPTENIFVIAATNALENVDRALLRPGRLGDIKILIDYPNFQERIDILKVHARNKPLAPDIDLNQVAKLTPPQFSGAQLENVMNKAAIFAKRKGLKQIPMEYIIKAIEEEIIGAEKEGLKISKKEIERRAYHESGHAIVMRSLKGPYSVGRMRLISAVAVGGYVWEKTEAEEKSFLTKDDILSEITYRLGGRAAEELIYGPRGVSTGAKTDLERATELADAIVKKFGMGPGELELQTFEIEENQFLGGRGRLKQISDLTLQRIDAARHQTLADCYKEAKKILQEKEKLFKVFAKILKVRETLEEDEIERIWNLHKNQKLLQILEKILDKTEGLDSTVVERIMRELEEIKENQRLLRILEKILDKTESLDPTKVEKILKELKEMNAVVGPKEYPSIPPNYEELIWNIAKTGKTGHWQKLKELFGSPIEAIKNLSNKENQKNKQQNQNVKNTKSH